MCRTAQIVLFGMPQEIQQQQIFFAGEESGAASDDLCIKRAYFGWTQSDNAIHRRLIPSFGEEHGIAQYLEFSVVEPLQDFGPVLRFAVDLRRGQSALVENTAHLL